jgi:hypothetical protein
VISNGEKQLENAIPATVTEIDFAGATSTVKLDANGLGLEALELASYDAAVGDGCTVVLPPEKISLLKDE